MHKYQCPIIHLSPEGDRCGAAGLRRGYVQATVTYVDSSSHHLSAQGGGSGCFKKRACLGPKFRVSRRRVAELWRGRSSNELEYCLLGGRSLWVGHQIKGLYYLQRGFRYATGQSRGQTHWPLKKGPPVTVLTNIFLTNDLAFTGQFVLCLLELSWEQYLWFNIAKPSTRLIETFSG